jgi:hypothetical protein
MGHKSFCVAGAALVVALAGSVASATVTGSGVSVPSLPSGAVQSFSVSMDPGDFLSVMTTPMVTYFSGPDTVIQVLDPGGTALIGNDDGGAGYNGGPVTNFGSALRVRAAVAGSYTIQVSGFPDFGFTGAHSESGPYGFTTSVIGTGPGDFPDSPGNNTPATADPTGLAGFGSRVGVGSLTAGAADVDFFSVTLGAGDVLSAMTTPMESPFAAPDTLLGVFDTSGTLVFFNDDGGAGWDGAPVTNFGSAVRFVAPSAGTYFLGVTGFGDPDFDGIGHGESGPYGLTLSVVPAPGTLALGAGLGLLALRRRRR